MSLVMCSHDPNREVAPATVEEKDLSLEEVVLAIEELDDENSEHYTASGKPRADYLSEILGKTVTADTRDAAYELFLET